MVANTVEFRAKIKQRMTELELRNKDLAEKIGYSVNSIDCVTGGYRTRISDELAAKICEVLKIPLDSYRTAS